MTKTTFKVTVEREQGFWIIRVASLPEVVTQAKRLNQVKKHAAEAIGAWLDKTVDESNITYEIVVPEAVRLLLDEASELQKQGNAALESARKIVREAVGTLIHDLGLPMREVGDVLGVSFQRVAQLAKDVRSKGLALAREQLADTQLDSAPFSAGAWHRAAWLRRRPHHFR